MRGRYIVLSLICSLVATFQGVAAAESPWLGSLPPIVKQSLSSKPSLTEGYCINDIKFITRPQNILQNQTEQNSLSCAVQTDFGLHSASITSDRIILNGTNVAGTIYGYPNVQPMPHSKHLMVLDTGAVYGTYASLIRNFADNIDTIVQPDNTRRFSVRPDAQLIPLVNAFGEPVAFRSKQFSSNGKWMISDAPYIGMTRANTETGETLSFGPPMNYNIGLNPNFISAISSDGRYAVFAENTYNLFRIYDLSTCTPVADLRKSQNCQWKDLLPIIKGASPNFGGAVVISFSTNTTIRVGTNQSQFTITAGGETESLLDYLAIGDSFASGEGAYLYKPHTDVRLPFNKCHLSLRSYPFLLQALKNINSVESVACSGARFKDIYTADTSYRSQAEQKAASFDNEIYRNFLAGYRTQGNFIQKNKPKIVTTSIGGNDIGFGKIIAACLAPGTCYNTPQDRTNLAYTIDSAFPDLASTYAQIKQDAATNSSVYIIGYPELVDPSGSCALNVHLNKQELILANQIVHSLNNVIQKAALSANVTYIDVTKALYGHRLCEIDSSHVAVNGLTAGDDKTFTIPLYKTDYQADFYLTGQESYHPNQLGHQLLAASIASTLYEPPVATQPSTDTLPANNPAATPRRIFYNERASQAFWQKGQSASVQAGKFAPSTPVSITIQDYAPPIANVSSNTQGVVEANIPVTSVLPPGLQTMQLTGKNNVSETITVHAVIYILEANQLLPTTCQLVAPANIDEDKDNQDDACDNFIDKPPVSIKTSVATAEVSKLAISAIEPAILAVNTQPIQARLVSASNGYVLQKSTQITPSQNHKITAPPFMHKKRTNYLFVLFVSLVLLLLFLLLKWRKRP